MRTAAAILAAGLAGCSFDASGVGSDDDATTDATATTSDGPIQPTVDAPLSIDAPATPIDASLPIDAPPAAGCDEPSDCGSTPCCQYGGLITACAPTCVGGSQVCVDDFDCDGNDVCCDTLLGARECTGFCL